MKTLSQIRLNDNELKVLLAFKEEVTRHIEHVDIILFGSKARGDDTVYSDIDILVITDEPVTHLLRERLASIQFELELAHGVIIGLNIKNRHFWESDLGLAMPLHTRIEKEGVVV
jgi:predicted nucleotidyltransferase